MVCICIIDFLGIWYKVLHWNRFEFVLFKETVLPLLYSTVNCELNKFVICWQSLSPFYHKSRLVIDDFFCSIQFSFSNWWYLSVLAFGHVWALLDQSSMDLIEIWDLFIVNRDLGLGCANLLNIFSFSKKININLALEWGYENVRAGDSEYQP